jgi:hypothetical protein
MTGLEIGMITAVSLTFLLCISIIVGGTLYTHWKFKHGGIKLIWNHDDLQLKKIWEDNLQLCREVFDARGAEYGFWKPGAFLSVSGYMKVEVQRLWFDLGSRGLAAGMTIPGQKHIKVCLVLPKKLEDGSIVEGDMMGTGAPWDGALIHEMNHFAYEYIYGLFDYNHAADGDGLTNNNGCWTHEHDEFIAAVQAELKNRAVTSN